MAQPGVAREPSMEEILASIRRIIESNEPGAPQPVDDDAEDVSSFDLANHDDDLPPVAEVAEEEEIRLTIEDQLPDFSSTPSPQPDTSRAERVAAPQPAPITLEPAPRRDIEQRSISLADVAARVRAASERSPLEVPRGLATEPQSAPSRPVELRPAAQLRPVEPVSRASTAPQAPAPLHSDMHEANASALVSPRQQDVVQQQVAPQPSHPTMQRSAEAELASLAANDRPSPAEPAAVREIDAALPESAAAEAADMRPLVSAQTGLQVARSFDELADMVHSTAKRSLDEVAEELLRPMLQEWLDDNLPTLVERLVREEIERVARGSRR